MQAFQLRPKMVRLNPPQTVMCRKMPSVVAGVVVAAVVVMKLAQQQVQKGRIW